MTRPQTPTAPQLGTLLIGTDFSAPSSEALRWVGEHLAPAARLVLVHVIELPRLPAFLGGPFPQQAEVERTLRAGAEERLEATRGSFAEGRVRAEIRAGHPDRELAAAASEAGADLVAVGRHGMQRGIWKLLGSTVEGLMESCAVPVLLCRNPLDRQPRTILVVVDESGPSRRALAWGAAIARQHRAELVVLHVINDWYARQVERVGSRAQAEVLLEGMASRARQWLDGILEGLGLDGALPEVRTGGVVAEILAAAESRHADLLVMGGTGEGRHLTHRLGSVTRAVLQAGHCPVLVVGEGAG